MDNYKLAQEAARRYFLRYDQTRLAAMPGVQAEKDSLSLPFLGGLARVCLKTGNVTCSYDSFLTSWDAGFGEALSVYDWLCDRKPQATASGQYCPVHSLPGVIVSGQGLTMNSGKLGAYFDKHPDQLHKSCAALGGTPIALGDIGYQLPVFPEISVLLKFYHSDEDFPSTMTLLWDRNILDFIKYETVYYVAGCLFSRLKTLSGLDV